MLCDHAVVPGNLTSNYICLTRNLEFWKERFFYLNNTYPTTSLHFFNIYVRKREPNSAYYVYKTTHCDYNTRYNA